MKWGWFVALFRLHGYWLTQQCVESVKLVQAQFKPRPDDILLVTYPKCGTSWLKPSPSPSPGLGKRTGNREPNRKKWEPELKESESKNSVHVRFLFLENRNSSVNSRLDERTKQLLHSTQLGPTCQKPIKVSPNKTLTPPPSGQPHTPTCSRRRHPPRVVLQPGSPRRLPRVGASLRPILAGHRRPAWLRPPTPSVDGAWLGASSCSTRHGLAASSFSTGRGLVAIVDQERPSGRWMTAP
jgi:hypothetical protein